MSLVASRDGVVVVGICGGSASGKTWLADRLASCLEGAARVSVDSFYLDRSHLPSGRLARINFDHPRAIDWPALEQCVSRIKSGQVGRVPTYNFATHARGVGVQCISADRYLVLDGLWLLMRSRLRSLINVGVFLECPAEVRLQRRIERDVRERGRTEGEVLRQFYSQVEPMHRRHVEPQAARAGLLMRHPLPEDAVDHLARLVEGAAR